MQFAQIEQHLPLSDILATYPGASALTPAAIRGFLPDASDTVSHLDHIRLLPHIALACKDETLGLGARPLGIGANDLVFRDISRASCVMDALASLARNFNILLGVEAHRVILTDDEAIYCVDDNGLQRGVPFQAGVHFAMETFVLGVNFILSDYFSDDLGGDATWFYTMRPKDECFGRGALDIMLGKIRYSQSFYGMAYKKSKLSCVRSSRFRRPPEAQIRQLAQALVHRRSSQDFISEIRSGVISGETHQKVLAANLGVSPATLRRKMAEERSTFRAIRDRTRNELAKDLLQSGFPVDHVAGELGYSDGKSFVRAFKRWNGITPAHFLHMRN